MHLKVYKDNGSINSHEINKNEFIDKFKTKEYKNKVSYISSSSKEINALNIFKSYFNDAKSILFDDTNKLLVKKLETLKLYTIF